MASVEVPARSGVEPSAIYSHKLVDIKTVKSGRYKVILK